MSRNISIESAVSVLTVEAIFSQDSTVCVLNWQSYEDVGCHISCAVCAKAQNTETSAIFCLRNKKARAVVYQRVFCGSQPSLIWF